MNRPSDPRARQQAAVASFTLFALQSRQIATTIERALDVVTGALSVRAGALLRLAGPGSAVVVRGRGSARLAPGQVIDAHPSVLQQTVSTEPLAGAASLSVLVVVEGLPWGRLLVCDGAAREFDPGEIECLQMITSVLSVAMERDRVDVGQAALAAFGPFALASRDLAATIEHAIEAVQRVAEAPFGAVMRLVPGRPNTVMTVQTSEPLGLDIGREYEVDPSLAAALATPESLIIEDWRADPRFTTPMLPRMHRSIAYLAPAVVVDGRTWGRLVASDTRPRRFSGREVQVASSIASVLAAALERGRQEGRTAAPGIGALELPAATPVEVALVNRAGIIVWVNREWETFARENDGDPLRTGVGVSYLACCDDADDPLAEEVGDAIRAAVSGDLPAPMRVNIPCHSPKTNRWFDVLISSRLDDEGNCIGAAITLSPVPSPP